MKQKQNVTIDNCRERFMRKHLTSIIIGLVFLVGLCVLLYPSISNFVNSRNQSHAIADYDESFADYTEEDFTSAFETADSYNNSLRDKPEAFFDPDIIDGYNDALNVSGTGIMGYIDIDKIDVELPIYHTTDESVLQIGVGHLQGTSLPVGGKGTHCVLSGHRGLPSAKLFSDLDQLEEGDTFTITVLNRLLTYKIDQIKVVLPEETDDLMIDPDKDYCTLITCTPYGVNSHRMLVRGVRTENAEAAVEIAVSDVRVVDPSIVACVIAIPIILIIIVVSLFRFYSNKRKQKLSDSSAK